MFIEKEMEKLMFSPKQNCSWIWVFGMSRQRLSVLCILSQSSLLICSCGGFYASSFTHCFSTIDSEYGFGCVEEYQTLFAVSVFEVFRSDGSLYEKIFIDERRLFLVPMWMFFV